MIQGGFSQRVKDDANGSVSTGPRILDGLAMDPCTLCPRACGVHRALGQKGFCGANDGIEIARAALHYWEEPPISGENGSGAIFFSHCTLRCIYCQNREISWDGYGQKITTDRLSDIMIELQNEKAHTINLVTASHYAIQVRDAVDAARKKGLYLPVVYNSSGYERPETIDLLENTVDVWLPDCKYSDKDLARALSHASDYPQIAMKAIEKMVEQVERKGGRLVERDGIMRRGIIVRHLVLPGHVDDSIAVLASLWNAFGNSIDISVMNQYTPPCDLRCIGEFSELSSPLDEESYETVLDWADELGFENLWWQQGGTVGESFIPAFDGTGVLT